MTIHLSKYILYVYIYIVFFNILLSLSISHYLCRDKVLHGLVPWVCCSQTRIPSPATGDVLPTHAAGSRQRCDCEIGRRVEQMLGTSPAKRRFFCSRNMRIIYGGRSLKVNISQFSWGKKMIIHGVLIGITISWEA